MKSLGKKGKRDKAELDAITPALKAKSGGKCMKCGKLPDFRGLSRHHLSYRSQGGNNSSENVELWCGVCHDAEHFKSKKAGPRDRTGDFERRRMKPA